MGLLTPTTATIVGCCAGFAGGIDLSEVMRAQSPGPDIFIDLWNMAKGGTPAVVAILLAGLYYVNAERKAGQTRYDALFEKYVVLGNDTNNNLKDFRELFTKLINARGARE